MWSALRVRPPALQPSAELRWVLLRAFAPLDAPAPRALVPSDVVRLSRELDLAARIATRHESGLANELGSAAARELTFHRLQALAIDRVLSTVADEVLHIAKGLSCPVLWLKHAALGRLGLITSGERAARDVDLLVPQTLAPPLQRALLAHGFRGADVTPELHLPPLRRAAGEVVEIHTALWGVTLPGAEGQSEVSAPSIIAGEFVEPFGDGSYTPCKAMLAAHVIVHGLVQHRTSPEGYPIMRVLSDLCSLGALESRHCLAFAAHPLARALTTPALQLCETLRRGEDVFELSQRAPEFELLSHAVAAGMNPAYRRALRFERVFNITKPAALRRALRSALATGAGNSSQEGSEAAHASANSPVVRPVALALELARGAASYSALRFRRP